MSHKKSHIARFLDELTPRLETARALERELDRHLARRFNAFDYLRTDELGLSRIVADLCNPKASHGQGPFFLKRLLVGCGLKDLAPLTHTQVEVEVEKAVKDDRRLDICVQIERRHCIAIENKPYAGDQPDQVRDYLNWLQEAGFQNYALIYLSPFGEPPSSESVEQSDFGGTEGFRHFKILPYQRAEGNEWQDGFDQCRLEYSLTEWLADCRKHCDVDRLGWFLREAESFCKRTFGGHNMGDNEVEAVKGLALSDESNWDASLAVYEALPQVIEDVSLDFLKEVFNTWPEKSKYKNAGDCTGDWQYYAHGKRCYLSMSWKNWSSYRGEGESGTQIRLQAESRIDSWFIGVLSNASQLTEEGRTELNNKLTERLGSSEADSPGWVWWQWIDGEYQQWNSKVFKLHRACKEDSGEAREFLMHFVEKFASIAEVAVPIIDKYEGSQ